MSNPHTRGTPGRHGGNHEDSHHDHRGRRGYRGLLYGTLTLTHNGADAHGRVTGGTGTFTRATGTITAKPANKTGTHSAVTITYTS